MKAKRKIKGFMAIQGVLACILLGMVGLSFLQIYSGQFAALAASRKAIQAQQYAQSAADLLRNTSYDKLTDAAHTKQAITGGNGWMSEVSIGDETTVNEVKQRMGTIKVYRNSTVTSPDYSLNVPLSSAGSGSGGGLGLPDYSKITQIGTSLGNGTGSFSFVAPQNGYIIINETLTDGGGVHIVRINGVKLTGKEGAASSGAGISFHMDNPAGCQTSMLIIKKDDVFYAEARATGYRYVAFIPAV